jgi:hypothetical protein
MTTSNKIHFHHGERQDSVDLNSGNVTLTREPAVFIEPQPQATTPEKAPAVSTSAAQDQSLRSGPGQAEETIILLGVKEGTTFDSAKLQDKFPGVALRLETIPKDKEPSSYMQDRVRDTNARLGIILDEGILNDNDTLTQELSPFVAMAQRKTLESLSKTIAKAIKAIEQGKTDLEVVAIVREGNLTKDELTAIVDTVESFFTPVTRVDWESALRDTRIRISSIQGTKATITTSGTLEDRPDILKGLETELGSNKDTNILVITDARITKATKKQYLQGLDSLLKEHYRIDRQSIYADENIVTLEELQDIAGPITDQNNALTASETLVKKVIGEDYGELVYVGGEELYKQEIDYAFLIKGVLEGDVEAITKALTILGKDSKDLRIEDLRNRVIDLRGYTKDIQEYRQAMQEVKRAL